MEDMYGVRCRYGLVGGGDGLWWLSTLWILEASYPWPQLRYGWDGWMMDGWMMDGWMETQVNEMD